MRNARKLLALSVLLVVAAGGLVMAQEAAPAAEPATLYGFALVPVIVDGEELPVKGLLIDGTTYLPVRAYTEAVGGKITWNQESQTVSVEAPTAAGAAETESQTESGLTAEEWNAMRGQILDDYALACNAAHEQYVAASAAIIAQYPADDQVDLRNQLIAEAEAVELQARAAAKAARDSALAALGPAPTP